MRSRSLTFTLTAGATLLAVAACTDPQVASARGSVADKPLAVFRGELLDLAFRAASSMPVDPHLKSRSRAQEAVVVACIELDQPQRALGHVEKIGDWRRGACYAALAYHLVQRGQTDVQQYLDRASRLADESAKGAAAQAWRTDRIKADIARTHVLLGRVPEADQLLAGMADSESGRVHAAKASRVAADALDGQLAALDGVLATGSLDQVRSALETCAQLYDRFYENDARRSELEQRITTHKKVPGMVRIQTMAELCKSALRHGDRRTALALLDETRLILDSATWLPEHRIPVMAQLAGLRHRAGDEERARREADAALASFDEARTRIVDIERAGTLRPLAEAFHALGDSGAALSICKKAVEECVQNPNSRPRAEDLSAVCISMAVHGIEPDATLWTRIRQICEGLSDPW